MRLESGYTYQEMEIQNGKEEEVERDGVCRMFLVMTWSRDLECLSPGLGKGVVELGTGRS